MTAAPFIAAAIPSLAIALVGLWLVSQALRVRRPVPLKIRTADRDRRARH